MNKMEKFASSKAGAYVAMSINVTVAVFNLYVKNYLLAFYSMLVVLFLLNNILYSKFWPEKIDLGAVLKKFMYSKISLRVVFCLNAILFLFEIYQRQYAVMLLTLSVSLFVLLCIFMVEGSYFGPNKNIAQTLSSIVPILASTMVLIDKRPMHSHNGFSSQCSAEKHRAVLRGLPSRKGKGGANIPAETIEESFVRAIDMTRKTTRGFVCACCWFNYTTDFKSLLNNNIHTESA